jgi:endo-1,4-beta-xylanase
MSLKLQIVSVLIILLLNGGKKRMRKNFKKFFALLLIFTLAFPTTWFNPAVQAEESAEEIPVLLYHRIVENPTNEWTDTSIEKFEQTMRHLQENGFTSLTADEYVQIKDGNLEAPSNPILLTFDDATPDFITNALPILEKYNMHAVLFVVSDWIDGDYSMTSEQLTSLVNNSLVSLQNHTKSHTPDTVWTTNITAEQANEEIATANEYLKTLTGNDPILMAYPYGAYNEHAIKANEDNGIRYAFKAGLNDDGPFEMGRYYIKMETTVADITNWLGVPLEEDTTTNGEVILHHTFEDGQTNGWSPISWEGTAVTEVTSEQAYEGTHALHFHSREKRATSPSLDLTNVLEEGKEYNISFKAKISEGTDDFHLASKVESPELDNKNPWLIGNKNVTADEWVTFETSYTVPMDTTEFRIWLEANDAQVQDLAKADIFIDDFMIKDMTEESVEEPTRPPAEEFAPITFEDGTTSGFEGRSGTETLTVTDEANRTENGTSALKVENRTETWHGPSLNVAKYIDKGQEYRITAWVKLISPETSQIQLSTQVGTGDSASYNNIQSKTITTTDGWVQLEGTYRYNSIANEALTIYVESSNNATASFYIDDITFEPTGSGTVDIERDLQPLKDVYKDHFLIGNAVSMTEFEGTRLELLKMHYNLISAENAMKPGYAYDENGEFDFTAENALVQRAMDEGFNIHGHVLVWHQQSNESLHTDASGNPLPREVALENLRTHVKTAVENFGPNVISWDVVNEAMNDNPPNPSNWKGALRQSGWLKAIGTDYIEEAFKAAKEVIDENGWDIKLYYNDYNDDNQNKAEAIYQMVKEINENYASEHNGEKLIDGIGMQAHYNLSTKVENVRNSLEKFLSLGVEVGVTELDITAGSNSVLTEEEEMEQAYLYAQLFALYKEHSEHISRVTIWGLNDASSWRSEQSPLLFDKDLKAKAAYYAIIDPEKFLEDYEPPKLPDAKEGTAAYGTPTIDGDVDSIWEDAMTLPVSQYQTAWQGANGTAQALWDEENLYVLVKVSDSSLDKSSENPWEQDSVEVFVDENNGKTTFYEEDDGQYRVNYSNEASFNPAGIEEGFESATVTADNGYTVEFKIPLRTIEPSDQHKIGFDVQINDGKDGARQSAATWNDLTGVGYQDTSVYGVLTLEQATSTPDPDPDPTPNPDPEPSPDPEPTPDPEEPNKPGEPNDTPKKDLVIVNPTVEDGKVTITNEDIELLNENGVLHIDLSNHNSTVEITLTNEQVKHLKAQQATVIIQKQDVQLHIPASNFTKGDEAVTITLTKMKDIEQAISAVYDFSIQQGEIEITQFDTPILLGFTIDTEQTKDSTKAKIYYWNETDEKWEEIGGELDNDRIVAETSHFSTFTVFEQTTEDEENIDPKPEENNGTNELPNTATDMGNYLIIGIVLLIIGAIAILIIRRRDSKA